MEIERKENPNLVAFRSIKFRYPFIFDNGEIYIRIPGVHSLDEDRDANALCISSSEKQFLLIDLDYPVEPLDATLVEGYKGDKS